MAQETQFNALAYFKRLAEENRLAAENGFTPCYCSGPDGIQGVMESFRKAENFIMVDDTTSQNTHSQGVGFFDRNVYTVFIVGRYKYDDMKARDEKLKLCRRIFRQFISRMIHDKQTWRYGDSMAYLDLGQIFSKELPRYSMMGVTGLYFMVNNEEPVDLVYEEEEWRTE